MSAASTSSKAPSRAISSLPARPPRPGCRARPPGPAAGRCTAREREERAHAGHGDDVVAAGVPDAGQRVVLRQHRDRRAVGAARPPRGARSRRRARRGSPRSRAPRRGRRAWPADRCSSNATSGWAARSWRAGEERVLEVGDRRAHVVEQFLGCAVGVRGRRGRRRGTRLGLLAETTQQEWVDSARALRHVRLRFHGPSRQLSSSTLTPATGAGSTDESACRTRSECHELTSAGRGRRCGGRRATAPGRLRRRPHRRPVVDASRSATRGPCAT